MTSVLLGLAAALLWGATTMLLAAAADGSSPRAFVFWYLGTQAALVLPIALATDAAGLQSLAGVGTVALAGLVLFAGTLLEQQALRREPIAVVAPLIGLEGAVAAVMAVVAGEPLSAPVAGGLTLAVVGGLIVGLPPGARWMSPGSVHAIAAAALFGAGLWLIAQAELGPFATLALYNGMGAALVLAGGRGEDLRLHAATDGKPWLLPAAGALSIGAFVAYMLGARAESVAITAVLAAQFGVVAAIGGYVRFGERLPARRLLGIVLLTVGAGAVAAASA
jgi:drug/metabolite transporter (DMT)-like permease